VPWTLLMPTLARRPNNRKKPNNMGGNKEERISKLRRKSLSPNDMNNDP